ncbi:MAG: hypothetical protein KDC54_08870, partial [Lewinella sp.]|nr:hypothetical protein [Lewinella sp.]
MKNRQIMTNGSLRYGFLLLAGLFLAFLIQGCGNDAANAATGEDEAAAAMAATEEAAMDPV